MKKKKSVKPANTAAADNFVMLYRSMFASPAYRVLSGLARRVLACLILEHLDHGGRDNGRLICPYGQIMEYCCTKDKTAVSRALQELRELGFIDFKKGWGAGKDGDHAPNEYLLTFLPVSEDQAAANKWAHIQSIEDAKVIAKAFRRHRDRSNWFNGAAAEKSLKSGVRTQKNNFAPKNKSPKNVAKATSPGTEFQPGPGRHVNTGTGMDVQTENLHSPVGNPIPVPGSHVVDSYLDATHIVAPAAAPPPDRANPKPSTRPGDEIPASDNSNNGRAGNPVSENGNGAEPKPMASKNSPWLKNDADWFRAHPERHHRVRRLLKGEAINLNVPDSPVTRVITRMVKARERERMPIYWQEGNLPATEIAARAMFDLVIEGDGYLPTVQQLIERIQRYSQEEA